MFAIGNSIVNRSSKTNIGQLALEFGGGGHANAGTMQVDNEQAEATLAVVIQRITDHERRPDKPGTDEERIGEAVDEESVENRMFEDDSGLALLEGPSRQDILEIHERLDRIEKMIAALSLTPAGG